MLSEGWHNMRGPSVLIKKVTSELSSQERISEYLILELMLIRFLIKTDNLFQKWRSGYFGVCFERQSISIIMGPVCHTHLPLPCQPGLSIQSSAIGNVCTSSLHSCHRWLHFHSSSAADVAQSFSWHDLIAQMGLGSVFVPTCLAGTLSLQIQSEVWWLYQGLVDDLVYIIV